MGRAYMGKARMYLQGKVANDLRRPKEKVFTFDAMVYWSVWINCKGHFKSHYDVRMFEQGFMPYRHRVLSLGEGVEGIAT